MGHGARFSMQHPNRKHSPKAFIPFELLSIAKNMSEEIKSLRPLKRNDYFPFSSQISFKKVLAYWERIAEDKEDIYHAKAVEIIDVFKKIPALSEPFTDISVLNKYYQEVTFILSTLFPINKGSSKAIAITYPFDFISFLTTRKFDSLITLDGRLSTVEGFLDMDLSDTFRARKVYSIILKKFYKVSHTDFGLSFVFKITNDTTGLDEYYKMLVDLDYVDIVPTKPIKELSEEQVGEIVQHFNDLDYMRKVLPPEDFIVEGFFIIELVNVSDNELLRAVSRELLLDNSLMDEKVFANVQQSIRSLFNRNDLNLGLGIYNGQKTAPINFGHKSWNTTNDKSLISLEENEYVKSIYYEITQTKQPFVCESLDLHRARTSLEKGFLDNGAKSFAVIPLVIGDEVLGYLEISSPNPWDINRTNINKIESFRSIFAITMNRSIEANRNKLEAITRKHFTKIHPTVEWIFAREAKKYLDNEGEEEKVESNIVLHDIMPLFGMTDIKNSSDTRNDAIKKDIIYNLKLVNGIIEKAIGRIENLSLLDIITKEVEEYLGKIEKNEVPIDEFHAASFYEENIRPYIEHIRHELPDLREEIEAYEQQIETSENFICLYRNKFEKSIEIINKEAKEVLNKWNVEGQKICPHYFERYATDGVEYLIYFGSAITPHVTIDSVCKTSLLFWQLEMMCELTKKMDSLAASLPTPLRTTQLILAYNRPLSLLFNTDEKRFEVIGNYNVRYEVIKKRIDKATIEHTGERLTKPGTIAIVYTSKDVKEEYLRYIKWLTSKGLINERYEDLELAPLQGVKSLHALRITVKKSVPKSALVTRNLSDRWVHNKN